MTSLAATSVLLILSTGCGAVLGTMHRTSGKDRATSRLAEADAQMTCGGQHCDAVPLERSYWDRYSKPWFFGGAAADLALAGGGAYAVSQGANVGSVTLLTIGILFVATDAYFLGSGAFTHYHGPWLLPQPVSVDWHGTQTQIGALDLVEDGTVRPTFSIAVIRGRLDRRR